VQCLCHCEAIFCSDSDFDRILKDKNYVPKQPDMPENFVKWAAKNEEKAANPESSDLLATTDRLQKFIVDSQNEYLRHDTGQWERAYFNKENGGYLVVDNERIVHSKVSKNEKAKFDKEYAMSMVFAQNGYKIEMLKEIPRVPSPDVTINGMKADLKRVSGHNNIVKEAKSAVRKQGAEVVLFEFEKETKEIYDKLEILKKKGYHAAYFFSKDKGKVYTF
jgi:hypothetical protein